MRPNAIWKAWLLGEKIGFLVLAKATAIWMSIIESAKANGLNPYEYIQYLLEMIPQLPTFVDEAKLAAYLPWIYKNTITKVAQAA